MSKSHFIVALSLSIASASVGWGYAQQRQVGPTLTAQDYFEIQQLYARYALYLDTGDAASFADLWMPDGEFVAGRPAGQSNVTRTPLKGTEALTRMGSVGGWRHFNSNVIITPTLDGADGTCYLARFNLRNSAVPAPIDETGIYKDTLVKTPQGWRFKKRISWRDDDDISPFRPQSR
jgi:SnoaL-like domain